MNVLQELRRTAACIANAKALEIIEAAQRAMQGTRFQRLRKRTAIPVTDRERAYRHALNNYVCRKIALYRKRSPLVPGRYTVQTEMEYWRAEMDRIEFGGRLDVPPGELDMSFMVTGHFRS